MDKWVGYCDEECVCQRWWETFSGDGKFEQRPVAWEGVQEACSMLWEQHVKRHWRSKRGLWHRNLQSGDERLNVGGKSWDQSLCQEFGFCSKHHIYLSSTLHTTKLILPTIGNKVSSKYCLSLIIAKFWMGEAGKRNKSLSMQLSFDLVTQHCFCFYLCSLSPSDKEKKEVFHSDFFIFYVWEKP